MTTGVVDIGSDLKRKAWMREGLLQATSRSFWSPFTGNSSDHVVYQKNDNKADSGHTVVFDFNGNLSGRAFKGKETARGKGEQKKKFSDKCTVERYRVVVDNGDKFDGVDIGDLSINEHSQSRAMLGDLFIRFKDQAIFDAAQGLLLDNSGALQVTTHNIDLGATFNFNSLIELERVLTTSQGYFVGGLRRPLHPYMVKRTGDTMEPLWLFVIDAAMAAMLRKDTAGYQTIMKDADVRGFNNRNIRGVIGQIGRLMIVEAGQFFGDTDGTTRGWQMNSSDIELAGLRQYDGASPATALWTGQEGFDLASTELHSRGLLMGAGAIMNPFGKQPDYKWKSSPDFDINSESALEFWTECRKAVLKAENQDYKAAKVANIDYGVVTVDVKVA